MDQLFSGSIGISNETNSPDSVIFVSKDSCAFVWFCWKRVLTILKIKINNSPVLLLGLEEIIFNHKFQTSKLNSQYQNSKSQSFSFENNCYFWHILHKTYSFSNHVFDLFVVPFFTDLPVNFWPGVSSKANKLKKGCLILLTDLASKKTPFNWILSISVIILGFWMV